MAIVNGRRLYNSRKLAEVAKLEDRAVAEYAYLMAGISDDWGRFLANPRVILGEAYRERPSVSEADVERWLALYNTVIIPESEHGLVRFYYVDGVRYGEWTNYMGDPPSQRQHHNCPEPDWSSHKHTSTCNLWGAAKKRVPRRGTPKGTPKEHPSVPTVPAVPSVPPDTATDSLSPAPAVERPREVKPGYVPVEAEVVGLGAPRPRAEQPRGREAPPNPLVNRQVLIDEGHKLIPQIANLESPSLDPTEVLAKASAFKGGRYVRLDTMPDDRLAHTINTLRSWHRRLMGVAEPEVPRARAPGKKTEALLESDRMFLEALDAGPERVSRADEPAQGAPRPGRLRGAG